MVQGGGVDGRDNSASGILLTESSDISRRIRSNLLPRGDQKNPHMVNRELSGLKAQNRNTTDQASVSYWTKTNVNIINNNAE